MYTESSTVALTKSSRTFIEEIEEKPSLFVQILNYFTIITSVICYLIIAYLLIFHFDLVKYFFTDYTKLQGFISDTLKIPIFIGALVVSVVISINPIAQLVPLVSMIAFFYGLWAGFLFGTISFFVATYLTMYLARTLGNKAVKKIIGQKNWEKANILANEEGVFPFFIAYLFPIFPNAIISWIAGTTKISILRLSIAATLGQIPGIYLSALIGSGIVTKNLTMTVSLFLGLVTVSLLLTKYRKEILKLVNMTPEKK